MPLVHIDTGRNFPEVLKFRDEFAESIWAQLIVGDMSDMIQQEKITDVPAGHTRHFLQWSANTVVIEENQFDAMAGGARRDEEKARAKERVFSHRDSFWTWDPKNQRAELWSIFNGRKRESEHFRVFPISNWTEQDIWLYILREKLALPSLYFAHERRIFERNKVLLDDETGFNTIRAGEESTLQTVRFRTIGDVDTTGAVVSTASSVEAILAEVETARSSERITRATDAHVGGSGMEEFKRNGWF